MADNYIKRGARVYVGARCSFGYALLFVLGGMLVGPPLIAFLAELIRFIS